MHLIQDNKYALKFLFVMMTAEEFIHKAGVESVIDELKEYFADPAHPLNVSDVRDEHNYQYVDLVQEGGGVWGIALVGYTYILEKMGIRFFSLAGTSAGSINAIMLACAGNKEEKKSEKIIQYFLELNLFDIVDGKKSNWRFTKILKRLLHRFISTKDFKTKLSNLAYWFLLLFVSFSLVAFISDFLMGTYVTRWLGLTAGIFFVSILSAGIYFYYRFKDFSKHGYGLNEGIFFHNWIKEKISENFVFGNIKEGHIKDMLDFAKHFARVPDKLRVLHDERRTDETPPSVPMICIISTDIVSERKIEFPRMWDLYWPDLKSIHPGDFIRASMSIPAFFETYIVSTKKIDREQLHKAWEKHLNWKGKKIPSRGQFIDGGALSNFPISVFANPNYIVPRMPTFGVRLQSGLPDVPNTNTTITGYLGSIIGTLRYNYDRDFINKNRSYSSGIQTVDMSDHNWLNFFMNDDEKIKIFMKGALAAKEFLKKFDWEDYKKQRKESFDSRNTPDTDPNNFGMLQPYKPNP